MTSRLRPAYLMAQSKKLKSAENEIPSMLARNLTAIKAVLEKGGVQFIDAGNYSGEGGPGVRLRK